MRSLSVAVSLIIATRALIYQPPGHLQTPATDSYIYEVCAMNKMLSVVFKSVMATDRHGKFRRRRSRYREEKEDSQFGSKRGLSLQERRNH